MRRLLLGLAPLALALLPVAPAAAQVSGSWQVTPVPDDPAWWTSEFRDVTAVAADDAWAVGQVRQETDVAQWETFTLAMHWDGASWTRVPTPSPEPYPGGTKASLNAVAAVSADDVWAGGEADGDAGGLSFGAWIHVQHWDGSAWEVVPVPEPPGGVSINFSGTRVLDAVAFAADDVWFGGQWGEPNAVGSVTWRPLAMHWDGSDLEVFPTPAPQDGAYGFKLVQFAPLAPDDIWAVCARIDNGRTKRNVVIHWDGSSWEQANVPDSDPLHELTAIAAVAPDEVWVFGEDWIGQQAVALHFDGSTWSEVADPPFALAAEAVASDAIWVGSSSIVDSNQVELFDGTTSVFVETFPEAPPQSVFAIESVPGGGLWAVGREQTPGNEPWAARFVPDDAAPSPWTVMHGGVGGSHGVPDLRGEGSLAANAPALLSLRGLPPGAVATLVVGLSELDVPFKGGVLVPAPDLLLPNVHADASGAWQAAVSWPAGVPAGLTLAFQAWLPDAGAPAGFAASHGLRASTP